MNIFVLDTTPKEAAKAHCDKHVVKMILESAQMLCTVAHTLNVEGVPYKSTHLNHPCTVWARKSKQNYLWLVELFNELHNEWQYRYNHSHNHKSVDKLQCLDMYSIANSLPDIGLTPFAQAMPDTYRNDDAIIAYRNYYLGDKAELLQYTKRNKPNWITHEN